MSTIRARKQANGSTRYTSIVRIRRGATVLHQESRTFIGQEQVGGAPGPAPA